MKSRLFWVMLIIGLTASPFASFSQEVADEWKLVWKDNFEIDGTPDADKWSFAGRGTPN